MIALIEGEEEIGSDHLEQFVKAHKDELRADIAVISDTNQFAPGIPVRGPLVVEMPADQ